MTTTPTSAEMLRERFEAWAITKGLPIEQDSLGFYANFTTGFAWLAAKKFQAIGAAIAREKSDG